jgi:hypothetical protein
MNTDANQLTAKRKSTARILCLIAAAMVILPCIGLHWLRAPARFGDAGMSLLSIDMCVEGFGDEPACQSMSNFTVAKMMRKAGEGKGAFAYAGIATIVLSVISGLALLAAGGLAFKDRFIRKPIALTTVALIGLCFALVAACVFIGAKPPGLPFAISWPFFLYALGVVLGIAGAQMLSKAYSESAVDPYWDGIAPEPPEPQA